MRKRERRKRRKKNGTKNEISIIVSSGFSGKLFALRQKRQQQALWQIVPEKCFCEEIAVFPRCSVLVTKINRFKRIHKNVGRMCVELADGGNCF